MQPAEAGCVVGIKYTSTDLRSGDTQASDGVTRFTVGSGQILPGLERAIVGRAPGDTFSVTLQPRDAFGERQDRLVKKLDRKAHGIPNDIEQGEFLELSNRSGAHLKVIVSEIHPDHIVVDGNHPMAGRPVTFAVEVVSVEAPAGPVVPVEEMQAGDGKTFPRQGDEITVHYVGTLAKDGTKFDSSRDRGTPFTCTIGVGMVIKGWDEGMMRMSVGQRALLRVPAAKGYGARGAGAKIPPHADLVFDVELLEVRRAA